MRKTVLFAAPFVLVAGSAFAQTPPPPATPAMAAPHRAPVHRAPVHRMPVHRGAPSADRPVDLGPNTPDANRAYQGGGVVLQGAPGGPAPVPQPTPPGQLPRNAVPQ